VSLLREDASTVVETMADETKAKFHKYVFLRNEPTDFEMKNMSYPPGREEVMEEKSPEKRWVRFPKRTHREGVLEVIFAVLIRKMRGNCGVLLGWGEPILDGYVISRTWS